MPKKNYMNQEEKRMFVYLTIFWDYLDSQVKDSFKTDLFTNEEKWQLKLATTWLRKTVYSVLDRIEKKSSQSIVRTCKTSTLELLPTKEMMQKIQTVLDTKDMIETLSEAALFKCMQICDGHIENCELRKILEIYAIPNFDPESNKCPYKCEIEKGEAL